MREAENVYSKPVTVRVGEQIHDAMKGRASQLHWGYFHHAYRLGAYIVLGLSEASYRILLRRAIAIAEDGEPLDKAVAEIRQALRAALVIDDTETTQASRSVAAGKQSRNR